MNALLEYWDHEAVIHSDIHSEERGDIVDDVLRRLDKVETDVSELRNDVAELKSDVRAISATIPHLATKADVADVKTFVANVRTELKDQISGVCSKLESLEGKIIKWLLATGIGVATLVIAAAKYLH